MLKIPKENKVVATQMGKKFCCPFSREEPKFKAKLLPNEGIKTTKNCSKSIMKI